jgi:hypothetical protein
MPASGVVTGASCRPSQHGQGFAIEPQSRSFFAYSGVYHKPTEGRGDEMSGFGQVFVANGSDEVLGHPLNF